MKKLAAITLTSMMLLLATAMVVGAVDKVEIRGQVATGDFAPGMPRTSPASTMILTTIWALRRITTTITEGNKLEEPNGIAYTTTAQKNDFEFEDWGYYNVIGFLAEKYFAGYINEREHR